MSEIYNNLKVEIVKTLYYKILKGVHQCAKQESLNGLVFLLGGMRRLEIEAERSAVAKLCAQLEQAIRLILDRDIFGLSRLLLESPELASVQHDSVRLASLNAHLNSGDTLLHLACREGFTLAVELITQECKADVNCQSLEPFFEQPLHLAAFSNTEKIVDILLAHGARSKAVNHEQITPFMCACREGSLSAATKILRLKLVDDMNARDRSNRTALYFAAGSGLSDIVLELWAAGAEVVYDSMGRNCLHAACAGNHSAVVAFLLKNGVRGDEPDYSGCTAIQCITDEDTLYAAKQASLEWMAAGGLTGRKLRQCAHMTNCEEFNFFHPHDAFVEPPSQLLAVNFRAETPAEVASRLVRESAAKEAARIRTALALNAQARAETLEPPLIRVVWPPKLKGKVAVKTLASQVDETAATAEESSWWA